MKVRRYDLERGPLFDFTSPEGFLLALKNTLRVRYNGLLWCGIPCSSSLVTIYEFWQVYPHQKIHGCPQHICSGQNKIHQMESNPIINLFVALDLGNDVRWWYQVVANFEGLSKLGAWIQEGHLKLARQDFTIRIPAPNIFGDRSTWETMQSVHACLVTPKVLFGELNPEPGLTILRNKSTTKLPHACSSASGKFFT